MIVVGANPRHSECSLEEVQEMRLRKKARLERAQARALKREDARKAAEVAEWERVNGRKRDKYSDIRVDRKLLQSLDKELEQIRVAEANGTLERIAFINDREAFFQLSEEGYRAKDARDRLERAEQEKLLAQDALRAALEREQDGISEQAYAGDATTMSFYDGSSLESVTYADLDASSVGSYDPSVASQWLPPLTLDRNANEKTIPMATFSSFMSGLSITDAPTDVQASSDVMVNSQKSERISVNVLPEDFSASTVTSFPSIQGSLLPSLPSRGSPNPTAGNSTVSLKGSSLALGTTAHRTASKTAKYTKSPYFLHGKEPPRPFSPPSFVIPDTTGKNWAREASAYDMMMERAQQTSGNVDTHKVGSPYRERSMKLPILFDPLSPSASPAKAEKAAAVSPLNRLKLPGEFKDQKQKGPPRLYKCELITPFTEDEDCPLVLEYVRLSSFNSTPAYMNMEGISADEDSDEEAWAEMHGVSHVTAKPETRGVGFAPLCWEAVFRKRTQEEVLAAIFE